MLERIHRIIIIHYIMYCFHLNGVSYITQLNCPARSQKAPLIGASHFLVCMQCDVSDKI